MAFKEQVKTYYFTSRKRDSWRDSWRDKVSHGPPPEIDPVGQLENPRLPFKDPEKQRTAVRLAVRKYASGAPPTPPASNTVAALAELDLETAQGISKALAAIMRELVATEADPFVRARGVAYVAQTALKAIEVGNLETKLQELRQLVEDQAAAAEPPLGRWRS